MGIVWTVIVGFLVGVLVKLLHPGKADMGTVATVLLGIGGSLLAGLLGQALGWYRAGESAGLAASVAAAIVLLVIYGHLRDKGE